MSFCPKCGRQLADGEVCTCQTAGQPQPGMFQQGQPQQGVFQGQPGMMPNNYTAAPKQPAQTPSFVQDIVDLAKGMFKTPADAVKKYVTDSSILAPLIIVAVVAVINMLGRLISMIGANIEAEQAIKNLNPWDPSTWVTPEPAYTTLQMVLGVFGSILYTFAAAALFAAVVFALFNFVFQKDTKVTYAQALAAASIMVLLSAPFNFVGNIVCLTPVRVLDMAGGWISSFGTALGHVFAFLGIKALAKNDNYIPWVYAVALIATVILSSIFSLVGLR